MLFIISSGLVNIDSKYIMIDKYIIISTVLFLGMGFAIFMALFPLLLVQHFIYKKILDPIYFNNKHFSLSELSIYNSFPLFLIKVITYIRAIAFPKTMLKRFKTKIIIPKENKTIYFLAWLSMLIIIYCGIVLINTLIMAILFYSNQ